MSLMRRISLILMVGLFVSGWLPVGVGAQVLETVDYVFPDPNTALGEPDPSVWASSGGLLPMPVSGQGHQIADPDSAASLLYFHASTELANASNNGTFQALVKTPHLADSSTAWSNDTTGFRLILDDSQKQLVLGLGRDPSTFARQVVVMGATGVAPIPFPWDNGFHNVYEIRRLPGGNFTFSATNNDPANVAQPVTVTISAASLPASTGVAFFAWGMGTEGGGVSFWQEVHGRVERGVLPFTSLAAGAEIALTEFEVKALFTLRDGSNGIDPLTEDVSFQVGTFSTTIPAGSFVLNNSGPLGEFKFKGVIAGVELKVKIMPLGDGSFEFKAEGEGADLTGTVNPVTLGLTIGDDGGSTTVTAEFE